MRLFLLILSILPTLSFSQIFLNEASNANGGNLTLADGSTPDWIEIYNSGASPFGLQGFGVSDKRSEPHKWTYPNMSIAAGGFFTLLATNEFDTLYPDHFETVVFANDIWEYFVPTTNMVNGWNSDLSAPVSWLNGTLGIGYGDGDDATTVTSPASSVYVRKTFTITDKSLIVDAILDVDYDDGFVAYLNGIEIARAGLIGTPPQWNEQPTIHEAQLYSGGSISSFQIDEDVFLNALVNGTNVLAIEVHSVTPFSTATADLSLIPYLSFGISQPGAAFTGTLHPYFTAPIYSPFLSTGFSISTGGEMIYLSDPTGMIVDSLYVPDLEPDMSSGKYLDGQPGQFLFTTATPGASNNSSNEYLNFEPAPTINVQGGFFTGSTIVTITNNSTTGGVIRYTLNGDVPTMGSTSYSGPITIGTDAVLTAICLPVNPNYLPSLLATETYMTMVEYTLPVISIVTDPQNLYGASGIFDNYTTDWKKPCTIEYFDENGVKRFETRASIKPDGGAGGSRSNPQHSVTIEPANTLYGSGDPVNYPLIPEKSYINEFTAFYLRNGSNYWNQYPQKDATFMNVTKGSNAGYQAYTPVIAYVNGQYFGVYELREKANEGYFEGNYGNDPNELDLLSVSYFYGAGILRTVKGSDTGFYNMRNFVTNYDPAQPDFFKRCHDRLDLYNFADYISIENWYGNYDWIYNNMKIARTRTKGNKWRFFLQDMELGLGGWADYNANIFDYFRNNNQPNPYWDIYDALVQNTEFRNYFVNRYADLMNTIYQPSKFTPIVDALYNQLIPEMPKHFQLWTGDVTTGMNNYAYNHLVIIDQMTNRNAVVRNQIINEFSLVEQVDVTLNVSPAGAGYIKISTIVPDALPWTGVYFDGVPVKITAVANPGYTFSNWQINSVIPSNLLDTNSIELNIGNSDSFIALFTGSSASDPLMISEVQYNADPSVDGGNWIEIHNSGATDVNLTGWKLGSQKHYDRYSFPDQTIVPAGGYLVVCEDTSLFKAEYINVTNYVGSTGFGWSNRLDSIQLFNPFGNRILLVTYADSAPYPKCADGWGRTLENSLTTPVSPGAADWFCGCIGGSPGQAYTPCVEELPVTEINYNNVIVSSNAGDWIEIKNNGSSTLDLSGYTMMDSKDQHIFTFPSVTLEAGDYLVVSNDEGLFNVRHPGVENYIASFGYGLSNNDGIRLYNTSGRLISSLIYNSVAPWPLKANTGDYTLEYKISGGYNDPNKPSSWFDGCEGGSPGRAFEPCPVLPADEELFLYPNPTESTINVVYSNALNSSDKTEIFIYDMSGKIVHSEVVFAVESVVGQKIDVSNFSHGMYYVRIVQSDKLVQKPFVKI